jgi:hypothetical protein
MIDNHVLFIISGCCAISNNCVYVSVYGFERVARCGSDAAARLVGAG